jgi:CheY-like chemotaxis protein
VPTDPPAAAEGSVLYYSAYASDEEQEAPLSVRGDAYLKKPVSAKKLEETMAELLKSKR